MARSSAIVSAASGIRSRCGSRYSRRCDSYIRRGLGRNEAGASYGDARLAADAAGIDTVSWNPVARRVTPDVGTHDIYRVLYNEYLRAYPALAATMHDTGN
jgi:hypothetical protein